MLNINQSLSAAQPESKEERSSLPAINAWDERTVDYQLLFEAIPTPIMVLAPNPPHFTIVGVNKTYAEATGKTRGELVGHKLFEVFPDNPDDPSATGVADLMESLLRVMQMQVTDVMGVQKYDIPRVDKQAGYEVRYWSPVNSPTFDAEGRLISIIHRVEDVTEYILQNQQSAEDSGRLQKIQANADQMEAEVLQRAQEVKIANRRFKALNKALEMREHELSELNKQLQELDRVKTAFFSNVSHEFRTPLTLMMGPIEEVLHAPDTSESHKRLLDIAYRNTLRLSKLVNNLLEFARIEAGRVQASFQPVDLAQLTRELASMFSSVTDRARLTLKINCPPLPEPVYVDRDMWEKIVLNLLSNAFKHTFEGTILVALDWKNDHVELSVQDTGVGIPEDQQAHLFERFHRVPNAKSRTQEGSGIGLALVNELVKLHSGDIQVSSQENQGTTFTVSIPTGRTHIQAGQLAQNSISSGVPNKTQPFVAEALRWLPQETDVPSSVQHAVQLEKSREEPQEIWYKPDGQVVRVLIADDNADMRNYVYRLLAPHCEVELATDGEAALVAARRQAPDLILSDIMMPRMNGMQLLEHLRKDANLKTTPLILLSARAGDEARVEGLQAGADDYLVKPFNNRELLARVKANLNLELHRAREAAEEAQAESEERFKTLFCQAAAGIAECDLAGHFQLVNDRYCDMLGRSREALLQLHMEDTIFPEDRSSIMAQVIEMKNTGESFTAERQCLRGDGSSIWVRNNVSLVRDRHGQPQSMVVISQDITERKAAELAIRSAQEDLKKYAARLERSNKELEHFATIASHDLQEPLRKVMMFSDHLENITENILSPEAKDDIVRLQRATRKMQTLIDNLLDLSRVARRGSPFRKVNLANLMTEVMADLHPMLNEAGGTLEIGNMIELEADPSQLQQLLENLISNAIKFHRQDVLPVVRVSSDYVDGECCQITVSDNGIGIKPEYKDKIFDAFVRLNSQNAYPGNGIGLTICQKIAMRHEGTIQVDSVPGEGSTFTVKLPIHQRDT
jgi:PAS domain S-box-containing protein